MQLFDVILIGIALSIDACALTIANCATYGNSISKKKEWLMPILFALFQGVMPLIGYFVGYAFKGFIGTFTKYLSAGIFFSRLVMIHCLVYGLTDCSFSPYGAGNWETSCRYN